MHRKLMYLPWPDEKRMRDLPIDGHAMEKDVVKDRHIARPP
jgi:hypothetical protein